jgi:hypothetical protein
MTNWTWTIATLPVLLIVTNGLGHEAQHAKDAQVSRVLQANLGRVSTITFSTDNRFLASMSLDDSAIIWDARTTKKLHTLDHCRAVYCGAFSLDGKTLATGSTQYIDVDHVYGVVHLWDTSTGKQLRNLRTGMLSNPVSALAYSPDGKYLAAGSRGRRVGPGAGERAPGQVQVWRTATLEEVGIWSTQWCPVEALSFSPDGKRLTSVGGDNEKAIGEIVIWDMESGKAKLRFEKQDVAVHAVTFSADGKMLATAAGLTQNIDRERDFGEVKIWDPGTAKVIRKLEGLKYGAYAVAFSPDTKLLVASGGDHLVEEVSELMVWELGREALGVTCADTRALLIQWRFPRTEGCWHQGVWTAQLGFGTWQRSGDGRWCGDRLCYRLKTNDLRLNLAPIEAVMLTEILARNDPAISSVIPSSSSAHGAQKGRSHVPVTQPPQAAAG